MSEHVRVDKWLWAARFFKTRSIAQDAINGGKVHIDGRRAKPNSKVIIGQQLIIRQGYDEKEVQVLALSDKRGSASTAQILYQETSTSIEKREQAAKMRKLTNSNVKPANKPNKKQRRQIIRFKSQPDD